MSIRLFCAASLIACSAITLLAVEPSTLAAAPNPQPFDHPLVFEPNHGQAPAQVQWLSAFEPVRRVLVDQLQFPASAINQTGLNMGRIVPVINMIEFIKWSFGPGGAGGIVRRDADESAGAPVCGDPEESEFAECDVQEAGDCPGG